jgi:flavin reductase (DIM6/NTAB) family NADH-FMN oxidoreductase RutF/DNA-binding IclR family transcriptional regulator
VTAAEPNGQRAGFVVGSFTSVSLDPPLVAFFPAKNSTSWPRIRSAGKFCVNILSAEQEDICRRFASRIEDKFEGIACRETQSGSPIIAGVVAWIDCDLESVDEAGDHYIVLGRVRRLEIEEPSLPLLFFRGGYGRFTPRSLAAGNPRGALTKQLREVDLVRPEMERVVTEIPGARCTAAARFDDELVVTACAGGRDATSPATLVGQRFPFVPPLGTAFAAWMDGTELENWLGHLRSDEAREDQRERLAAVRSRGFSVALLTDAQRELQATLDRLAADHEAVDSEDLYSQVRELDYEPVELSSEVRADISVISVPVFDPQGHVAMLLTVDGFPKPTAVEDIDGYIERVRRAGGRATELLRGHVPAMA